MQRYSLRVEKINAKNLAEANNKKRATKSKVGTRRSGRVARVEAARAKAARVETARVEAARADEERQKNILSKGVTFVCVSEIYTR